MKKRRRRTMAATELRIHLGEALRSLDRGEIVIEKGGIPVAVLSRYEGAEGAPSFEDAYERALLKRGDPAAWPRALEAMNEGWSGIDSAELKRNIRIWRELGSKPPLKLPDDDVPSGPRRVHRSPRSKRRAPSTAG